MHDFLMVEKIVLMDGTVLEDKQVFTNSGNFVIVSDGAENPTFTWYNVNEIRVMHGVTYSQGGGGKLGTRQYAWY